MAQKWAEDLHNILPWADGGEDNSNPTVLLPYTASPSSTPSKRASKGVRYIDSTMQGPYVYVLPREPVEHEMREAHRDAAYYQKSKVQNKDPVEGQHSNKSAQTSQTSSHPMVATMLKSAGSERVVVENGRPIQSADIGSRDRRLRPQYHITKVLNDVQKHAQRVKKISVHLGHVSRIRNTLRKKRNELRRARGESSTLETEFIRLAHIYYSACWKSPTATVEADFGYAKLVAHHKRLVAAKDFYGALESAYNELEDQLDIAEYDLQVLEDKHVNRYEYRIFHGTVGSASKGRPRASSSTPSRPDSSEGGDDLRSRSGDMVRCMTDSQSDSMETYISRLNKASEISGKLRKFRSGRTRSQDGDRQGSEADILWGPDSPMANENPEDVQERLLEEFEVVEQQVAEWRRKAVPNDESSEDGSAIELNITDLELHRNPLLFPIADDRAKLQISRRAEGALLGYFTSPRDRVNRWLLHMLRSTLAAVWLYHDIFFAELNKVGLALVYLQDENFLASEVFKKWLRDDASQNYELSGPETEHTASANPKATSIQGDIDPNILESHFSTSLQERFRDSSLAPSRVIDPQSRPRSPSKPTTYSQTRSFVGHETDMSWQITLNWVLPRTEGRSWIQPAAICCLVDNVFF